MSRQSQLPAYTSLTLPHALRLFFLGTAAMQALTYVTRVTAHWHAPSSVQEVPRTHCSSHVSSVFAACQARYAPESDPLSLSLSLSGPSCLEEILLPEGCLVGVIPPRLGRPVRHALPQVPCTGTEVWSWRRMCSSGSTHFGLQANRF